MNESCAYRKQYVDVVAKMDTEGHVVPLEVQWPDGRRFPIDKVLDRRQAHSFKCGGAGIRYAISAGGRNTYLFFENPLWFVEAMA